LHPNSQCCKHMLNRALFLYKKVIRQKIVLISSGCLLTELHIMNSSFFIRSWMAKTSSLIKRTHGLSFGDLSTLLRNITSNISSHSHPLDPCNRFGNQSVYQKLSSLLGCFSMIGWILGIC
jgi:hypothetical protein